MGHDPNRRITQNHAHAPHPTVHSPFRPLGSIAVVTLCTPFTPCTPCTPFTQIAPFAPMSRDRPTELSPTTPVVRRDGSITSPLWEQAHFVLAIRDVFLACRAPDETAYWRLVERALHHASLEGRAHWMLVLGVDPHSRVVTGAATTGLVVEDDGADVTDPVHESGLTSLIGCSIDAMGIPVEALSPPRTMHRCSREEASGPLARYCRAGEHVVCVPLFGGADLVGFLVAGVDERVERPGVWLHVFGDLLAWTAKGRHAGGALPGMGLPSVPEVVATAPDAAWMAHALELSGEALGVSEYPGQMSFVTSAGRFVMSASGVDDYAADIDGIPGQDIDEMAWRAQTMIAVTADPEGQGRRIVRVVPDGVGGEITIRFESRLVRHHVTGCIDRAVMLITPVFASHDPAGPDDRDGTSTDGASDASDAPLRTPSLLGERDPADHLLADDASPAPLSRRQREVALHLLRGDRPAMIADDLGLSVHTVRGHISSLYQRTGAKNVNQLLAALRRELS